MLIIKNGTVITGDGKTKIDKASLYINGTLIEEITRKQYNANIHNEVIDAEGELIIPGIINHHTHGVSFGPLFPSAAKPLHKEKILENLNKHLLQGTTTILNLDGFATIEEVEKANNIHPINIKTATSHTPLNFKAAEIVDGIGLTPKHKNLSVEKMLEKGAVVIGEIGGGHTLGGGGQEYLYIPRAIKNKTGRDIDRTQARILKYAVLGRYINPNSFDHSNVDKALKEIGLQSMITVEETKQVIEESVLPCFNIAIKGLYEGIENGKKYNKPVILHHSAPTMNDILKISENYPSFCHSIICAHSNHTTFDEINESLEVAKELKKRGCIIDIATFDCFMRRKSCHSPELFKLFFEKELVDLVSTDYCGGFWESILLGLEYVINEKVTNLPKAIAKVTSNVINSIPNLAPNRGLLEPGRIADIVIVNKEKISKIDTVIINGKIVVQNGKIVYQ